MNLKAGALKCSGQDRAGAEPVGIIVVKYLYFFFGAIA